jgi:8-oxo-dGTP diphosphatase
MKTIEKKYPKIVTSVFVFNDKRQLLMGKRIEEFGYGMWCMPGGKLEWGETLQGCAKRELKEETGITAENLEYLHLVSDIEKKTHFVHADFIVKKWRGVPKLTEPDKFSE